jgi:hypothetical protein
MTAIAANSRRTTMAVFRRDEERMLTRLWGKDLPGRVADEPKPEPRNVLEPESAIRQRSHEQAIRAELAAENVSSRARFWPHMHDPAPVSRILTMPNKASPDYTMNGLTTPHNMNHGHPKLVRERARGRLKLFAVN